MSRQTLEILRKTDEPNPNLWVRNLPHGELSIALENSDLIVGPPKCDDPEQRQRMIDANWVGLYRPLCITRVIKDSNVVESGRVSVSDPTPVLV